MVASIRPGYQLRMSGETQTEQTAIQTIVKYLFQTLLDHPVWGEGMDGVSSTSPSPRTEKSDYYSRATSCRCRPGIMANAYIISYRIVPKATGRIRFVLHAHNTEREVDRLVEMVVEMVVDWATEMLELERSGSKDAVPRAARGAYPNELSSS
ncbi:hypothetical protein BDV33DRAFT_205330 [Aspergillus novoparasiticus]|uniref:Pyridoxal phosphate-dependent transferase n=1 Tax=Aspergillus novoparasiticus TaxID=986946 RepID=A0A5N6EPA2_9EURO|nr:hypothetical protein BDV33DRAFT_205330 [Aspergillus novoparasiticus]